MRRAAEKYRETIAELMTDRLSEVELFDLVAYLDTLWDEMSEAERRAIDRELKEQDGHVTRE